MEQLFDHSVPNHSSYRIIASESGDEPLGPPDPEDDPEGEGDDDNDDADDDDVDEGGPG